MGSISGCGGIYRSRLSHRTVPHPMARRHEPPRPEAIAIPPALALAVPPTADCARYDRLRPSCAAVETGEACHAAA